MSQVELHTGQKKDVKSGDDKKENKSTESVDGNKEAPNGEIEVWISSRGSENKDWDTQGCDKTASAVCE